MTPPAKNSRIGDWVVDKAIGSGGQGSVWKVRYSEDRHSPPAALKMCTDVTPKGLARFRQELALLREQNDPGIVRVRDSGEHGGAPYFVMEYASTSLERIVLADLAGTRLVRESGTLLLMFLRQACQALSSLHAKGILHRDIKPGNILLMLDPPEPMRALLADLGVATLEHDQGNLTAAHEVVGSPQYRAPESLMGKHAPASDVYSFGKTIEFVFSGGLPSNMGPGKCSRSRLFSAELWDRLDNVLARACAYNPEDRFQTARELNDALPDFIVTELSASPSRTSNSASDTTLSPPELITLAQLIAECSMPSEWSGLYYVRSRTKLGAYDFSLALRRLMDLGLIESRDGETFNGSTAIELRPSDSGVRWAHANGSLIFAAQEEDSAARKTSDGEEDLPF